MVARPRFDPASRRIRNTHYRIAGPIWSADPLARIITHNLGFPPGSCLGVYEMIKPIGDGAMGQLFRAIRSWRDVAIKILPEAFSHDADRDAEF